MIKKISHTIFLIAFIISCNDKKSDICKKKFEPLNLYPVNTMFMIPHFVIKDSTIFGDLSKILNYKIESVDSSFSMYVFIDNHEKEAQAFLDLNHIAAVQKGEVESAQNSKQLIKEVIKNIGNIKVGYLKYLVVQVNKKFYASRIFFYKGKKLVVCWLFENYTDEAKNMYSVVDCVFDNIQIN